MRLAHRLAIESDLITADAIEATEFPELAELYGISAVPTTVINGTPTIRGALPEEAFWEQVLRSVIAATESDAEAALRRASRRGKGTTRARGRRA